MIRQIKNTFSKSSHRPSLSGDIKFYGLTKLFHIPLHLHLHLLLLLHLPLLLLFFSCNTNEPPKDNGAITLSVEDASCIEAWINLKVENITLPAAVTLKQSENNGEEKVRQVINLTTADTLLFIDSLLPKRSYKFKAEWINKSGELKAAEATTVTMDTTSHNFTWQTFTFGQHSSSTLYDVAIINENNIWAVGEIYMNDSLGNPDPHAYNAVHWDGNQWELKRIYFPTVCGSTNLSSYPAKAIFAFDDGKIWISSSGDKIAILKDGIQIDKYCLPSNVSMSINKLWGSSSNDLYAVGNGGNIAHWDGISWKKIESGTSLNLNDIWGDLNKKTNEWEVICVASNILHSYDKEVIKIIQNRSQKLSREGIKWTLGSIWFQSNRKYYLVGSGIYEKFRLTDTVWNFDSLKTITLFHVNGVRANDINDVYVGGAYGEIIHFNGINWKSYKDLVNLSGGALLSVSVINKLIAFTGYSSGKAIILKGKNY